MDSIGIFDSGLGGLTVVREVRALLPRENLLYLGDTARVPYGGRSRETIARYAWEDANFLVHQGIKILVVACNSAASAGLDKLKQHFKLPIISVIEPGARAAVRTTKNKKIGVIGTRATINSSAYLTALNQLDESVEVSQVPCPLFVSLVEEGWENHAVARQVASEYLAPLKAARIDTLILGCTHYPMLEKTIREVMGKQVTLINSAREVASVIKDTMEHENISNTEVTNGVIKYFVSDAPERFVEVGERFMGQKIQPVEQVKLINQTLYPNHNHK